MGSKPMSTGKRFTFPADFTQNMDSNKYNTKFKICYYNGTLMANW